MPDKYLTGKVALVTGASRGIGRAIALQLAEVGADLVVHYARKRRAAEDVVAAIESAGGRAIAAKANLADAEKTASLFDEVENRYGGCDIFIGNAASGVHGPVLETTDKHWDWTMDVNARSILRGARQFVPHMERAGWGRIVTVTSLGSTRAVRNYAAVGISKAAVEALTRYLAAELACKGIIVNAVSPGLVETDALQVLPINQHDAVEDVRRRSPVRRLVTAEDVAQVVAFLCSDAARMIVGQTLLVDGGYSLLADYFTPGQEQQ